MNKQIEELKTEIYKLRDRIWELETLVQTIINK